MNEAMQQSDTNRCYLAEILRNKAHRLSPETERAISALSQTFSAPYQIYNMAKLADMKFDSFTVNGTEYPLGYSLFEDTKKTSISAAVHYPPFLQKSDSTKM